jgi:hypothetical protein
MKKIGRICTIFKPIHIEQNQAYFNYVYIKFSANQYFGGVPNGRQISRASQKIGRTSIGSKPNIALSNKKRFYNLEHACALDGDIT